VLAWTQSVVVTKLLPPDAGLRIDVPPGSPCVAFDFAERIIPLPGESGTQVSSVYMEWQSHLGPGFEAGGVTVQEDSPFVSLPVGDYVSTHFEFCGPGDYLEYVELFSGGNANDLAGSEYLLDNLQFGIPSADRLPVEQATRPPSTRVVPPR